MFIFHSAVKVETEVVACHSYARSRTEINNQSMALVKKYILKRFFLKLVLKMLRMLTPRSLLIIHTKGVILRSTI